MLNLSRDLLSVHTLAFAVDGQPYSPLSDPSSSGEFERLVSFGARSFAIWRLDNPNAAQVGTA